MTIAAATMLGLIFGSFGTVVAYRVPRSESIVGGRSRCPNCGKAISALENVPVVSYLLQRGRCRHCSERISARYPLTEATTAVLFGLAVWRFGASVHAVAFAAFFWLLVVLTAIDLEHKLLPNRLVYPGLVAGWVLISIAAVVDGVFERLAEAALGAAVFGGFLFLIAFIYPAGMGGGDVKLALVLGTFLGYAGGVGVTLVGMFMAFVTGGIGGVVAMKVAGGNRKMQVPFGPFLALGAVIGVLAGGRILDAYLGTF